MPSSASDAPWSVYMVRCADGTLYTGVTTHVAERIRDHNERAAGARYTRTRRPVTLVFEEPQPDKAAAHRREHAIKRLARKDKLALAGLDDG